MIVPSDTIFSKGYGTYVHAGSSGPCRIPVVCVLRSFEADHKLISQALDPLRHSQVASQDTGAVKVRNAGMAMIDYLHLLYPLPILLSHTHSKM
jgi:hypothetical protein